MCFGSFIDLWTTYPGWNPEWDYQSVTSKPPYSECSLVSLQPSYWNDRPLAASLVWKEPLYSQPCMKDLTFGRIHSPFCRLLCYFDYWAASCTFSILGFFCRALVSCSSDHPSPYSSFSVWAPTSCPLPASICLLLWFFQWRFHLSVLVDHCSMSP